MVALSLLVLSVLSLYHENDERVVAEIGAELQRQYHVQK